MASILKLFLCFLHFLCLFFAICYDFFLLLVSACGGAQSLPQTRYTQNACRMATALLTAASVAKHLLSTCGIWPHKATTTMRTFSKCCIQFCFAACFWLQLSFFIFYLTLHFLPSFLRSHVYLFPLQTIFMRLLALPIRYSRVSTNFFALQCCKLVMWWSSERAACVLIIISYIPIYLLCLLLFIYF